MFSPTSVWEIPTWNKISQAQSVRGRGAHWPNAARCLPDFSRAGAYVLGGATARRS